MRAERRDERAIGKPKAVRVLYVPLALTEVSYQILATTPLKDTSEGQTSLVPTPSELFGNQGSFQCEPIKPVRLRSQAFRQAKG
jgi:hypothetical protein